MGTSTAVPSPLTSLLPCGLPTSPGLVSVRLQGNAQHVIFPPSGHSATAVPVFPTWTALKRTAHTFCSGLMLSHHPHSSAVLTWDRFLPRGRLLVWRHFGPSQQVGVAGEGGGAIDIYWGEAKDAAKHLQSTAQPRKKDCLGQTINSAEAEKACLACHS